MSTIFEMPKKNLGGMCLVFSDIRDRHLVHDSGRLLCYVMDILFLASDDKFQIHATPQDRTLIIRGVVWNLY